MRPKTFLLAVVGFASLLPLPASAQSLWTAEFVSGKVEYQLKGTRIPLSAGNRVDEEATVFLGKGALLELSSGSRRVSLVREGSYSMRTVAGATGSTTKPGILEALGGKLRAFFSSRGDSSIGGVRASEAAGTPAFMTGGDEAKIRGEASMAAGKYEAATRDFEYALEEALPGEEGSVRRLLATALAMQGRQATALGVLRGGEREDSPAVDMLEASLLLAAGVPGEALAVMRSAFPPTAPAGTILDPAIAAEAAELEGLVLEAMDKPAEAADAYRRAITAKPDSQPAARARQRLEALGY